MEETEIDNGRNRGKRSEDDQLFGSEEQRNKLHNALQDMSYLLSRDYSMKSSIEMVGNRYRLVRRQMLALQGMSCSAAEIAIRKQKQIKKEDLKDQTIYIDGFNLLILMESSLSGGYIFRGMDACYRDISSVHGTYKRVNQTEEVLIQVGKCLKELEVNKAIWVFDRPISNSGRLKTLAYELAAQHQFEWEIMLEYSPDKFLVEKDCIVVSSDAWVLNNCYRWFNLGAYLIEEKSLEYSIHKLLFDI